MKSIDFFGFQDVTTGRNVRGINLLALHHGSGTSSSVAFELNSNRNGGVTKSELMRQMIDTYIRNILRFHFVLIGSRFSSQESVDFVASKDNYFIASFKEKPLVALNKEDGKKQRFVRGHELDFSEQTPVSSWLKGYAKAGLLVRQIFAKKIGCAGISHRICSDSTCDHDAIITTYEERRKGDVLHNSLESNANLARSSTRVRRAQSNHIVMSICAAVKLEYLRACYELRKGAATRHNRPPAALRLLAVTRYCRVAAPCIWPVLTSHSPLPEFITGSEHQKQAHSLCAPSQAIHQCFAYRLYRACAISGGCVTSVNKHCPEKFKEPIMKIAARFVSRTLPSLITLVLAIGSLAPAVSHAHSGPHGGVDTSPEPTGPSPFPVIASGLANPRGILIVEESDGTSTIYVTEAGTGGHNPCLDSVNGDYHDCYGATGAITRISNGVAKRVVTGLPSIAGPTGGFAIGPARITAHDQSLFVSFSNYGSTDQRSIFAAMDPRLGKVLKISGIDKNTPPEAVGTADKTSIVADISAFEDKYNPDGDPHHESNPSGLALDRGVNLYAVDSGANDLLSILPNGETSLRYVFPTRLFPAPPMLGLPPGTQMPVQSVPTAVILGPDKAHYVAEFTGFPYPKGSARVLRFNAQGAPTVHADGFSNIIDIAFGPDGSLYVLEMARNGLLSQDVTGAVTKVAPNGTRTLLAASGIAYPTAIAVDQQGTVYVANYGTSGRNGQLVRLN